MITLGSNKYIESQNIRVFPCAYRGYYNSSATPATTLVFDPEARATTEANFTNTFHKISGNKESYVIAWVPDAAPEKVGFGTLKCVIGGYYFEIYNQQMSDFFYPDSGDPYYLCIKTESVSLGTSEPDETTARTTEVLGSFADTTTYLDVKNGEEEYVFTGLLVSTTAVGTAQLAPFTATPNDEGDFDYKLNPAKFPITNLLDVGSGSYSIRMIEDDTASGTNTTVASGDYSVALGLSTAATGKASTALGNNTEASAEGAFAAGNNTIASGKGAVALGNNTEASEDGAVALGKTTEASAANAVALGNTTTASGANSVALGSHTTASEANQVVIGQYNDYESDEAKNQAFIIANGTTTTKSNKFTVSYDGDVKALGALETKGNIKATGDSNNDLELGTSAEGSSGSIKVYGETEAETPVFSVENSGNTTIAGTTTISGNTSIAGFTHIRKETQSTNTNSGALKVAGGVGIIKNLNVGGATTIHGNVEIGKTGGAQPTTTLKGALITHGAATLNDTLTVAENKKTTLGGELAVSGATTINSALTVKGGITVTGNVNISSGGKATSEKTTDTDSDITLATKSYVDNAEATAKAYVDTGIANLAVTSSTAATTATGKYIQSITQQNGKIAANEFSFETTLSSSNNSNAPTSQAVSSFVTTAISTAVAEIWTADAKVKETATSTSKKSLQAIILDAIYPIGSIYMQYVSQDDKAPSYCPLMDTLPGSNWKLIEGGRFLRAVGAADEGPTVERGETGGSPDLQLLQHTHSYAGSATTVTGGVHQHMVAIKASRTGEDWWEGFEGNCGDKDRGWVIENTIKDQDDLDTRISKGDTKPWNNLQNAGITKCFGEHEHALPSISASDGLANGKNANLPPYIAVYMWRRVENNEE